MQKEIDERYDLPNEFARLVHAHVVNHKVITGKSDLISFWQAALRARSECPKLQESIAEWTVSCGASSPLVDDNGILEEIHATFGQLEVSAATNEDRWVELEKLIAKAHS